jgi:hypothetical protein
MSISVCRPRGWPTARGGRVATSDPFRKLDADWAYLCRRHRDSTRVTRWARSEPELTDVGQLADVIPPRGVDRMPRFAALARLTASGDELAARALLQLLVPGLVLITTDLGNRDEVVSAVVSTAWLHIARIRAGVLRCRTPQFVWRSVRRDVIYAAHTAAHRREIPVASYPTVTHSEQREGAEPAMSLTADRSAEDTAWTEHLAVSDAIEAAGLSPLAARIVWETAHGGRDVATVARETHTTYPTAYRLRDRAFATLREVLTEAS